LRYLTVDDLLELHIEALKSHGGRDGMLQSGLNHLEYVIDSQYPIFGQDQYPGMFLKAANIFFLINKDHAFIDGNKRTALLAIMVMLAKNGYEFVADIDSAENFTKEVASIDTHSEDFNKDTFISYIADWLRKNTRKIR